MTEVRRRDRLMAFTIGPRLFCGPSVIFQRLECPRIVSKSDGQRSRVYVPRGIRRLFGMIAEYGSVRQPDRHGNHTGSLPQPQTTTLGFAGHPDMTLICRFRFYLGTFSLAVGQRNDEMIFRRLDLSEDTRPCPTKKVPIPSRI